MNIVVRNYKKSDLQEVNEVLNEAFSKTKENFSGDNFCEIVAECDNKIVGYLLLTKVLNPIKNKYYCLVDYVCVLKNYRGIGVSDKMMEYAEEVALKENCIYLQLTCSSFRTSAHSLYKRCGYIKRDSAIYRKELL